MQVTKAKELQKIVNKELEQIAIKLFEEKNYYVSMDILDALHTSKLHNRKKHRLTLLLAKKIISQ